MTWTNMIKVLKTEKKNKSYIKLQISNGEKNTKLNPN